ncbi:hypothetical protein OOU_Y34scaffold01054g5 [Pyricularia oryzae Y34]|uniref:Uncharacterized protein n=1 Tax=Pyricularia oryzae (strain Y34) TaxID=1143189 RepID=A0AA97PFK1_PYRO3|nr:hypothetical protein OOU_Y34scaffold01054g5 [Pyricularia oryzae Y34]
MNNMKKWQPLPLAQSSLVDPEKRQCKADPKLPAPPLAGAARKCNVCVTKPRLEKVVALKGCLYLTSFILMA